MRVGVPAQQHRLKEHQARVPHRGTPPRSGSSILAIIGWTQNNSDALRNSVVEKSAAMLQSTK